MGIGGNYARSAYPGVRNAAWFDGDIDEILCHGGDTGRS
jgi:hypothetical protein